MKPAIEIHKLSKRYHIAHQKQSRTLREELEHFIRQPFRFAPEKNKQVFWALKNINLSVKQGEAVGIIGPNGAGKSTLLKILAGIVMPTSGKAILRGSVGSLLETGAGFHSELTGRENIYLSAATLGIKRRQVRKKFDEIIFFSGLEKFLDTPVKYYSSGMYIRLGFSVAVQLKPDILLVDEALSVGDAEFQKRSLNKLEQLTKEQGITVVFVTHSTSILRDLCSKGIYLKNGKVHYLGPIQTCIEQYLGKQTTIRSKN